MSRKTRIKHYAEYAALRIGTALLGVVSVDAASWMMGKLWQTFAPLNHRHARVVQHVSKALSEESASVRKDLILQHWNNLGRTFAEGLLIGKVTVDSNRYPIRSKNLLDRLKSTDPAAVFVSLHMGNWELLAAAAQAHGLPMAAVYQRASNPLVNEFIRNTRLPLYPGGLHAKKAQSTRHLLNWLQSGSPVCMIGDNYYAGGVDVQFFGRSAPANPLPALLAHKSGAPLIAAVCRRTTGCQFEVELVQIPLSKASEHDERISETTRTLHAQFEKWIKDDPAQWMWGIRRWQMKQKKPPRT